MKVVIVSNIDNGKGLQRDYALLKRQLSQLGHRVLGLHFEKDRHRASAEEADLLVCLETLGPEFWDIAPVRWLIPNPEWLEPAVDISGFERILVKTREGERLLSDRHPMVNFIGWTTRDFGPPQAGDPKLFLHVAGGSIVKGTASVLKAWREAKLPKSRLVIVGQRKVVKGRLPKSVELRSNISDEDLGDLYRRASWLIAPSEVEGFGHIFREAQSAGCGVVTTDASPMNEVVGAELVPSTKGPLMRLAQTWTVSAHDLGATLQALGEPDPGAARAAWEAGHIEWQKRIEGAFGGDATTPRVSICFPCHEGGVPLLMRSIAALRDQTVDPVKFEVCVGADGDRALEAILSALASTFPEGTPFKVTTSLGERPRGDVPHRNHARNAAWRASSGETCWILDCDFCLEPTAIEHLLAEMDRLPNEPVPVFSPLLVGFGGIGPIHWLKESKGMLDGSVSAMALAARREIDEGIFSGYPERATDEALGPASEPLPAIMEGQPCIDRCLLVGLGGFDEGFGEWGGDKEELIDRLKGLEQVGLVQIRLLTSTKAWHQPHDRDKGAHTKEALQRQNERRRRARLIQGKSSWWRVQVERVKATLRERAFKPGTPDESAGDVDPVLAREAPIVLRRSRRRNGSILVAGRGAEALASYLTQRGITATTVLSAETSYIGLVAVGLSPDEVENKASKVGRGAGLVVLVETGLNGRGHPPPIAYQRAAPGLNANGVRRIYGDSMTLLTGSLVR